MYSPETIRDMAYDAGEAAKAAGDLPFSYYRGDPATSPFPFPNIGDHRPNGWLFVDSLFADATGWGNDNEPALSVTQLEERIREIREAYERDGNGVGFAIVETGQFQVRVGVFENLSLGTPNLRLIARKRAGLYD